jgi:glycosyltransferase involved in cell wall biosynthesis
MSAPQSGSVTDPLVTIAIPTFNRASWLKGCVLAALAQSYSNFELLVSDNASTDETPRMLRELDDPRLRVIRQETNIGLLPNWNACLAAARGEYIVVVSDDDRIAPWFLERCMGLIRQHPKLPIVVTVSDLHSGQLLPGAKSDHLATGVWDGAEILLEFLREKITATICGIVMRTDLLRARGGFPLDMPYAADVAAWAPLLFCGKAGLINEACATYYIHNTRETTRLKVEQLLCDGWKAADIISDLAAERISDPQHCRRIQIQSGRCFARGALIILSSFSRQGASSREVLGLIWRFRNEFGRVDLLELVRLRREVAIIILPRWLTGMLRYLKRALLKSVEQARRSQADSRDCR